ncbi:MULTISPECIES: hypothetical protein [Methylococcus]|uniref:Uncharacterized protein n=1 Tax=Methylococcus capsulatus (strain ATCC 33009 / NCIMB 11132 / Bath) TaxID=243233 RepID=Q602W0_METCA|nr:hypothetical protein [Methylococcus capsulatus]AAU90943.1 hypothetical protein MCA2949 [Methylococcus capsulatus str. Bath]QXP93016.1 hypothetical protein KW113_11680 [Methylococcus capsulatus]
MKAIVLACLAFIYLIGLGTGLLLGAVLDINLVGRAERKAQARQSDTDDINLGI